MANRNESPENKRAKAIALATRADVVGQFFGKHEDKLLACLSGTDLKPERLVGVVMNAVRNNEALAYCDMRSLFGAAIRCGQLGLEPDDGRGLAYIIPRREKGVQKAQAQPGYKGFTQLAYNSGVIASIEAHVVYEGDDFRYQYGLNETLNHIPCEFKSRGKEKFVYAIIRWTDNSPPKWLVMDVDEALAIRDQYSDGYKRFAKKRAELEAAGQSADWLSSPWDERNPIPFGEMLKKTVLRRLLKLSPTATRNARLAAAIALDEKVEIGVDQGNEKVIDIPPNEWETEQDLPAETPEHPVTKSEELADRVSDASPTPTVADLVKSVRAAKTLTPEEADELLDLCSSIAMPDADREKLTAMIEDRRKAD